MVQVLTAAIKPKKRVIFLYLLIPMAVYIFVVFIPLIAAFFYSFFEWKGGPNKTFIGFGNYAALIKDTTFWESFGHNMYIVIACIIGQVGLAFVFAMMISSRLVRLKGIHRTFCFFPNTISAVSIGFIWTMIYDYRRGILNWFLKLIGRPDMVKVWLNEPDLVLPLISIPLIWQYIGFYMVIIISAIASVDKEIFEVAELDGANGIQRAFHIVLPLIKNTLLVCVTLCIAGNMKVFDHIFVMTAGGPGNASNVMAMYGYKIAFDQQNMGYGTTISLAIFVLSMTVIGGSQVLVKILTKEKETL